MLKETASKDLGGRSVARLISEMTLNARQMLARAERLPLKSRVVGKRYFSFRLAGQSRPINEALYAEREGDFLQLLRAFQRGFRATAPEAIVSSTYSIAYSVFAANDVCEVGRKASATFFEILIGHIVARAVGVAPRKKVRVPESGADLPTDYVFDPEGKSRKIHLPIKASTRERAVQAWVHQLVLDRIFGTGVYRGVLVVAAETKRDSKTGEVIEICVPKQLQMFQSRVAELSRVYYLDPPQSYLDLASKFPRLEVRSFGQALSDLPTLLYA
ncbi:MAG TPA: hypothetical protein VFQ24_03170 [Terriglobia bacterium]|nr:hypothetical protein [Terriglobia bacterium]